MTTAVLPLKTGTLKVAPIRFYCSPTRPTGIVLQLGYFGEIVVPGLRGLGLIARPNLTEYELNNIGEIGRRLLHSPFAALSKEFDLAWTDAPPGKALEFLRARHLQSFRVEAPEILDVPHRIFMDGHPVRTLVRGFLSDVLDEEGINLVAQTGEANVAPDEPDERVEIKQAA
jgi:hypothetical protein